MVELYVQLLPTFSVSDNTDSMLSRSAGGILNVVSCNPMGARHHMRHA